MTFRSPTRAQVRRAEKVKKRLMDAVGAELARGDVSAPELLALLAHTTGACIAYQDQRAMTAEQAMELVFRNIEAGNAEALAEVMSAGGLPS